jgi:NADH:ubiquinone oxidoreductase subunit 6 (subunit J)
VSRRALTGLMFGSLAVGVVLMVVFHAPVTRVIGVLALFTFIVTGVFLIADPRFLGQDDDRDSLEQSPRGLEQSPRG